MECACRKLWIPTSAPLQSPSKLSAASIGAKVIYPQRCLKGYVRQVAGSHNLAYRDLVCGLDLMTALLMTSGVL